MAKGSKKDLKNNNKQNAGMIETLKTIMLWPYHNPMYFFGALVVTTGAAQMLMQGNATAGNRNNGKCLDYFTPIAGNAKFGEAKFHFFLEDHLYSNDTELCIEEIAPHRVLVERKPLGMNVPCQSHRSYAADECIGWDKIDMTEKLKEKAKFMEEGSIQYLKAVYDNSKKFGLEKFEKYLNDLIKSNADLKKSSEETYGFTEENIKITLDFKNEEQQDYYRSAVLINPHLQAILKNIKEKRNVEDIFKPYKAKFAKIGQVNYDEIIAANRALQSAKAVQQFSERNDGMNSAINQYGKPEQTNSLVTGIGHFLPAYSIYHSACQKVWNTVETLPSYVVVATRRDLQSGNLRDPEEIQASANALREQMKLG